MASVAASAPPAKRQKTTGASGPTADDIATLRSWLTSSGAVGLDGLTVGESTRSSGGLGLFRKATTAPYANGGAIAAIPQSCCPSTAKALETPVGKACAAVTGSSGALREEHVLFLDMAVGRRDTSHPFYPYLHSLPADKPNAPFWTAGSPEHQALEGTNLGAAATAARESLGAAIVPWLPKLAAAHPELFAGGEEGSAIDEGDVQWASSMYESRHFPAKLAPATVEAATAESGPGPAGGRGGIMLPFLDMTNHDVNASIAWTGDGETVTFRAIAPAAASISGGSGDADGGDAGDGGGDVEVLNNYGVKRCVTKDLRQRPRSPPPLPLPQRRRRRRRDRLGAQPQPRGHVRRLRLCAS